MYTANPNLTSGVSFFALEPLTAEFSNEEMLIRDLRDMLADMKRQRHSWRHCSWMNHAPLHLISAKHAIAKRDSGARSWSCITTSLGQSWVQRCQL